MEGSTEYRAIPKGRGFVYAYDTELSMGWVDTWVGLGWVEIFQFLVGWVGSTTEKVLKI